MADMSLDRVRWRIFVDTVDESAGSIEMRHVLTSWRPVAFQESFSSTEYV